MTCSWTALHERYEDCSVQWDVGEVRNRIVKLTGAQGFAHRLTKRKGAGGKEWFLRPCPSLSEGTVLIPSEVYSRVSLTFLAVTDRKQSTVLQFTVAVEVLRKDESRLVVGVHLDPPAKEGRQRGAGRSTHARLHCHVGPDYTTAPVVRVPFPSVRPEDAVSWVCSVIDSYEPSPWREEG